MDWKCQKRIAVIVLALLVRPANVQFAMPMFPPMPPPPPPPMLGMAPPMQMPIMQIQIPNPQKPIPAPPPPMVANNLAIPVPMPMPLQVAVSAQMPPIFCAAKPRPPSCPPCPPCICFPACTPAFFSYCSSCHQKCRCRDGKDAPVPLPPSAPMPVPGPAFPFPMPIPPPSIIVPVPPIMRPPNLSGLNSYKEQKHHCGDASSDSSDDSSSSSSSEDTSVYQKRSKKIHFRSKNRSQKRRSPKKLHKKSPHRIKFTRRTMSDDVIKPVLSFVNVDGDARFTKRLTEDDVQKLTQDSSEADDGTYSNNQRLDRSHVVQNVKAFAEVDELNQTQLRIMSKDSEKDLNENFRDYRRSNKQVILRKVGTQNVKPGRKELVFKPPYDKKISNLSLSFQIV